MARQAGIIKLKGKVGDMSFYKTKDGYLAREKGGVDKERIQNDPAFRVPVKMGLNLRVPVLLVER